MTSPVFGGKMTSTSGKTPRQSSLRVTCYSTLTSNLQASSSRDANSNAITVDTALSDGSVSPFEAVEAVWGSGRVGGGRDPSDSVNDVSTSSVVIKPGEAIPLIMLTNADKNADKPLLTSSGKDVSVGNGSKPGNSNNSTTTDNANNKITNSNSTSNIQSNTNKNSTNNNNNNSNIKGHVYAKSLRPPTKPVSKTSVLAPKPNVVNRPKSAGVKRAETPRNTTRNEKDKTTIVAGLKTIHKGVQYSKSSRDNEDTTSRVQNEVKGVQDSKSSRDIDYEDWKSRGSDCLEFVDEDEKQRMLNSEEVENYGKTGVCDKCGADSDGKTSHRVGHVCKNIDDNDNSNNSNNDKDDDNDPDILDGRGGGEKRGDRKSKIFCCFSYHQNNKVRDKSRTESESPIVTKNVEQVSSYGQSSNEADHHPHSTKGVNVKVKRNVQVVETKVDEEQETRGAKSHYDSCISIPNLKVDDEETKTINTKDAETNKSKVGEMRMMRKKRKKAVRHLSVEAMVRMTATLVVPNMDLIPEGRRYEDYYMIEPHLDLEFGQKPDWVVPRLRYYYTQMGCGTSNQVVAMEGRMPIVVFGATGVIGGSVVKALLKDPRFMVKAVTRTPTTDQARNLAEIGAVVVPADLNDVRSLQRVMEGAAGVFLTTNFWEHLSKQKELNHGMNAIDAAVSCNVAHFIFQGSEHTRDDNKPCGHLNAKAAIEEYVKETSLAYTSIHLPFLYENLLSLFKPHCVEGSTYTIPIPMGEHSMDCMSLHDFARCVVNIFLRPKNHMLKSVQLTGDRMSIQHMADVLNRHFDDKKFLYHKLSPNDFATFDFQGSQDLAAMFEFMQTSPHRDPRITRRIHHSVVCFDKWVADNRNKLVDAIKDTGDGS